MAVNKRLLQGAAAAGGLVPSEHFGVVLYEGDGSSSHSINGGKFGAGAYFGGSADATLPFNLKNTPFTISFWAKNTLSSTNYYLIANHSGSTQTGWLIGGSGNSGTSYVFRFNSGTTSHFNFTSSAVTDTVWHHVVMTFDNTTNANGAKIYINGSLDTQATSGSTGNVSFTNSTTLLMKEPGGSLRSTGLLDQVRIFTKALSSSEVSTLYAETASTVESLDPLSEDTTDTLQVLGDSSCVATYRFENNEDDLSGNYDATGYEIQYGAGRYGQALDLNGTSSYAQVGTSDIITGTTFSVSIWVLDEASSGYREFFSQQADNNKGLYIGRHNTTGTIRFNDLSISCTLGSSWNHLVFTVNGSTAKTYQNGSLIDTKTNWAYFSSETVRNGSGVRIGRQHGTYSEYWLGKIDQLRLFNKELSASEVTTLYNENSLVASYRFEGNANDDTRNYDGTASNVTYEYGLNGFTPDFVWIKQRDAVRGQNWFDSTRGVYNLLQSNNTNANTVDSTQLTSFDAGGFTVGSANGVNASGGDFVAWCLKANGGTTSSNTDGTITSTVQVNTNAGFSIVKYTGNNTANATIGHGLSSSPQLIISKNLDNGSAYWATYHHSIGITRKFYLNDTSVGDTVSGGWLDVSSTLITLKQTNANNINENGSDFINYCFTEVDGFSKFGSYTGTGSATDRPIIETGFEPAFVMVKNTSFSNTHWVMFDNKRNLTNPRTRHIKANSSNAEENNTSGFDLDFLSNGFQVGPTSSQSLNKSSDTYIYMAFAADPDTEAPTVAKSFSTVTYSGTGSTRSIEGLGFQPNLVWFKERGPQGFSHGLYDSLRGPNKILNSNLTNAETTLTQGLLSFDADGFSVGNNAQENLSNSTYVAWAWKADDNEPTINTEGSINSLVSANANSGFSIAKWTANGSNATIGHGLSSAPEFIIMKNISSGGASDHWVVGNSSSGWTKAMHLNLTNADGTSNLYWNDTSPTATVFSVGAGAGVYQRSGDDFIAYCFHSVSGYSKFGSYSGNGTTQTITTGFQPDWVLIKSATSAYNWFIYDSVRSVSVGSNPGTANARPYIIANVSGAENGVTSYNVNFDSNGFSVSTSIELNGSGQTYIYMAFKIN